MNQENKETNKLRKVNIPFHEFIQEEVKQKSIPANSEILTILLTRESWEEENIYPETEEEVKQRVQNWVMYDPEKDKPVYTQMELMKYKATNGVVNSYQWFIKNIVRFKVFKAILGRHYDDVVKFASRGRAKNMPEVILVNIDYLPKYFRAYGLSGLWNYCLHILDYRRIFQLGFYIVTMGGVLAKATYLLHVEKNQPKRFLPTQDFAVIAKAPFEQGLLLKGKFGRRVEQTLGDPLIKNLNHTDLTRIVKRTDLSPTMDGYPFAGLEPEMTKASRIYVPRRDAELEFLKEFDQQIEECDNFIDDTTVSKMAEKYPTATIYELMNAKVSQKIQKIKEAVNLTNKANFENLIEEESELEGTNFSQKYLAPAFKRLEERYEPKLTTDQDAPTLDSFLEPELVKNIFRDNFTTGPYQDWNTDQAKLVTPSVEISTLNPLFEWERHALKGGQIHDAYNSLKSDKLMGHYLSTTQLKTEDSGPKPTGPKQSEGSTETENLWEDAFATMQEKSLRLISQLDPQSPYVLEDYLPELFTTTATVDLPFAHDPESWNGPKALIRISENPSKQIEKEFDLFSVFLPTVFLWYVGYNLYRFRMYFIYNVRKKPVPVLYTRFDHYGRLRNRIGLPEVMGVDGSLETLEKLFAALQRARGMGIYIPTVILSAWESTLSPFIPATVDHWFILQREKIKNFIASEKTKKLNFASREPSLSENVFALNDPKSTFAPRFNFLKSLIAYENEQLLTLEKKKSTNLTLVNKPRESSGTNIQNEAKVNQMALLNPIIGGLKSTQALFSIKNLLKFSLKTVLWIETELSNMPLAAALKPGRYGLNDLPKGMLLVGEPGNGRSFLARAIASESRLPFFKTESTRFIDPKFGVLRLMALFRRVRNQAPGILFIRDIDLITIDRERTNSPELIQLTTQFLICFDGYYIGSETRPTQRKVFTLGSVSNLSKMDPACLRSGRFEWIINLRNPAVGERKFLLKNKATKSGLKIESTMAWNYFDVMTEGFTNAEVVSLVNTSSLKGILNKTLVHTNNSFNEALRGVFLLRENQNLKATVDEGFFNKLHQAELLKGKVSSFETLEAIGVVPFKTKCIHLLTSLKNWENPKKNMKTPGVLTMQNLGINVQQAPIEYSHRLMNELLELLAEGAFLKQLRRCSPPHTFVTQTSYCENLSKQLNITFAEGCETYRLERTTAELKEARKVLTTLAATSNWQSVNSLYLKDLRMRTNLLSRWYRNRTFYELETYDRVRGVEKKTLMSASMVRLKERIIGRLYEYSKHYSTPYSVIPTIRGTYGTRDFKMNVRRPAVAPVSQTSRELLEMYVK